MDKKLEKEIEVLSNLLEEDRFHFADIKNKYYYGTLFLVSVFAILISIVTLFRNKLYPFLSLLIILEIISLFYLRNLKKFQYHYQKEKKARRKRYEKLGVDYDQLEREVGGKIT